MEDTQMVSLQLCWNNGKTIWCPLDCSNYTRDNSLIAMAEPMVSGQWQGNSKEI